MNEQLKIFGRNVEAHMQRQVLTAITLARRANVSPKTINNIINGRHASQLDVLSRIAAGLKVPLWQLWLPEFPVDLAHDDTFPRLVETAAQLSPAALKTIARMADLELEAGKRS